MNSIKKIYDLFLKSSGVCTDTRKLKKGNLFFALSGENYNGNRFATDALEKGALAVIMDDPDLLPEEKNSWFLVKDSLKTLQELAHFHRQQYNLPVLAITGTNGKTTTKELCAAVLSTQKNICATQGNLNNHIGVPLTVLKINNKTEIAIIEMGANHPGEIATLCRIAQPTHGLITNIGKAHLEGFGNFEGVIKTKNELYRAVQAQQGTVFVNKDSDLLLKLSEKIKRITYGTPPADIAGTLKSNRLFVSVTWQHPSGNQEINTHLYGSYNFSNIMAALSVGNYFDIPATDIVKAITRYEPRNNRSQYVKTERNLLILDAYNANPDSMSLAINDFAEHHFSHPVLILGDMFELGKDAGIEHQKIVDKLKNAGFKEVILAGDNFYQTITPHNFKKFKTTDETIQFLKTHLIANAHILVKGSRGMQMENIVQYL